MFYDCVDRAMTIYYMYGYLRGQTCTNVPCNYFYIIKKWDAQIKRGSRGIQIPKDKNKACAQETSNSITTSAVFHQNAHTEIEKRSCNKMEVELLCMRAAMMRGAQRSKQLKRRRAAAQWPSQGARFWFCLYAHPLYANAGAFCSGEHQPRGHASGPLSRAFPIIISANYNFHFVLHAKLTLLPLSLYIYYVIYECLRADLMHVRLCFFEIW